MKGYLTMNIEVNLDNLTKEEQEQFNALVEKANKPQSKVWKPEKRDTYYVIDECADICDHTYKGCIDDIKAHSIGNCFKTKEEAKFALEKLKVIAEMKRYIAEHDDVELDWNNYQQRKHYIFYLYPDDENGIAGNIIGINNVYSAQELENTLYASSLKILKDMIKEIGEDRIKKYYFGVE